MLSNYTLLQNSWLLAVPFFLVAFNPKFSLTKQTAGPAPVVSGWGFRNHSHVYLGAQSAANST